MVPYRALIMIVSGRVRDSSQGRARLLPSRGFGNENTSYWASYYLLWDTETHQLR